MHTPNTPSQRSAPSPRSGIKALACAVVALALTAGFSWSFVDATSVARIGGGVPASLLARVHLIVHA